VIAEIVTDHIQDAARVGVKVTPQLVADAILAALPQTEGSEAVREALEPFAKIAEEINKDYHDSRQIYQYGDLRLYGADFRRARQALALPVDNTSGDSDG
jgi:hypothetical protein